MISTSMSHTQNNFFTDHLRREPGLPNSTNISGYIAQKTKSNAPVFNDASRIC